MPNYIVVMIGYILGTISGLALALGLGVKLGLVDMDGPILSTEALAGLGGVVLLGVAWLIAFRFGYVDFQCFVMWQTTPTYCWPY